MTLSKCRGNHEGEGPDGGGRGEMVFLGAVLLSQLWTPICLTTYLYGDDLGKHQFPGCGEQL